MIYRKIKNKNNGIKFTAISNDIFNDNRLSLKAKGLLCYMLSKPDNWQFTKENIMKETKVKRKQLDNILEELKITGYVQINKTNGKFGRFIYEYDVFENPP